MTTIERRQAMVRNGYKPVPVVTGQKAPRVSGWPAIAAAATETSVLEWPVDHDSTGILCGAVCGLDIDVPVTKLADDIEFAAVDAFGDSPLRRVGEAPKVLLLYRAADPTLGKMSTPSLNMPGGLQVKVEALGCGQQAVAFGDHPKTGKPYLWTGATPEDVPLADLPIVDADGLRAFLASAERILRDAGASGAPGGHLAVGRRAGTAVPPPDAASVAALLDRLPNPIAADRDRYVAVMSAAAWCASAVGDDGQIEDAAIAWAERWEGGASGDEREKWARDWSTRTAPLAGWQTLQHVARELIPGYGAEAAAADFPPLPAETPPADSDVRLLEMTEDAAAAGFALRAARRFAFDWTDNRWLRFDPATGWEPDKASAIFRAVRDYVRASRATWGEESSKSAAKIGFVSAVERGCRYDEGLSVTSETWDADPFVLGVPGGSVDLRTGELRAAAPEHFILRRASVAPASPGSTPETWLRFLNEATGGDAALQGWLQRLLGYALTGDVSEEMLAFFYGPGGNGKGVLLHTVSAIMGAYAYQAPTELFTADSRMNREYQLARLDGVRLLLASETESGAALAESFVKEITGNEGKLNARHPYGRPFEFKSQAKLIIVGNHAPKLSGRTAAMERRLRVVPFNRKPPTPDLALKDKLIAEYPAILRWMIDGCLAWQRDGLGSADAIGAASVAYFSEQDALAQFIAEQCDIGPGHRQGSAALHSAFNLFLQARRERSVDARSFKESLSRVPGVEARHTRAGNVFDGLRLRYELAAIGEAGEASSETTTTLNFGR